MSTLNKKREFYIVDKKILSTSIQKVIEVNELIQRENISKYEAIKRIGISRSTYYKYKDYIKPFFEENTDSVFNLYLSLTDHPGVLSMVLDLIAKYDTNILTVIQNIPIDNIAHATLSIQTKKESMKNIEKMLEGIRGVNGVKDIRIIGNS
nr:ACT domain-containing protein [Haliovirga abyssi]